MNEVTEAADRADKALKKMINFFQIKNRPSLAV